jgi:hypothetical protein
LNQGGAGADLFERHGDREIYRINKEGKWYHLLVVQDRVVIVFESYPEERVLQSLEIAVEEIDEKISNNVRPSI